MSRNPTDRQMTVLATIHKWIEEHDQLSPSYRQLAEELQCRSVRTITEHVHALRALKLIVHTPEDGRGVPARTLFLTPEGRTRLAAWTAPEVIVLETGGAKLKRRG